VFTASYFPDSFYYLSVTIVNSMNDLLYGSISSLILFRYVSGKASLRVRRPLLSYCELLLPVDQADNVTSHKEQVGKSGIVFNIFD
jgi:hypothetical protein